MSQIGIWVVVHHSEVANLDIGPRNGTLQVSFEVYWDIILHGTDDVGGIDTRSIPVFRHCSDGNAGDTIWILVVLPAGWVNVRGVLVVSIVEVGVLRIVFTAWVARRSARYG